MRNKTFLRATGFTIAIVIITKLSVPSSRLPDLAPTLFGGEASAIKLPNQSQSLQFRGGPIHPACIFTLTTDLADSLPVAAAVDVQGCTDSNRFASWKVRQVNEWVCATFSGRTGDSDFSYRSIGCTNSGTYAVETASGGAGTGRFRSLLFLKISDIAYYDQGTKLVRKVLRRIGSYDIGDRIGVDIRLDGDDVTILIRGDPSRAVKLSLMGK